MKKLLSILLAASVICFSVSCDDSDEPTKTPVPNENSGENPEENPNEGNKVDTLGYTPVNYFQIRNHSGHTISIVHKPSCETFPDSLVLLNGERYKLISNPMYDYFFKYEKFTFRAAYFDGKYVVNLKEGVHGAHRYQSYKYDILDNLYLYIYTEKDYLYAVEHGIDLETAQQEQPE